jgi:DNA-binding NarL/FixJ family response regulator
MSQKTLQRRYVLIIDDHSDAYERMQRLLKEVDSSLELRRLVKNVQEAKIHIDSDHDKLALIVVDLGIPELPTDSSAMGYRNGIALIEWILDGYPQMNILIRSADPKRASQLKARILEHEGGFSISHKQDDDDETIKRIQSTLNGDMNFRVINRELGAAAGLKPIHVQVLKLANEGYGNKKITELIAANGGKELDPRTIGYYLQDIGASLGISSTDEHNFRVLLLKEARKAGMVD